jgi:hypothetical protein
MVLEGLIKGVVGEETTSGTENDDYQNHHA